MEDLEKLKGLIENGNIEPIGDGKGVFLPDMDEMEYEEYDRLENKGWKGFYKKVKNLGKRT
ncbi:hypothetical protein CMI37_06470 [Candidatus Pacearchaeota archaeon]|jgi:hypothetical protein|nr:hypothetical protein [Candidatus Pacearchaeota archaeon]|tara:strand:- start:1490 stop:1672 length:183 start_codon:yes stop_codon:yes gene_type:complete